MLFRRVVLSLHSLGPCCAERGPVSETSPIREAWSGALASGLVCALPWPGVEGVKTEQAFVACLFVYVDTFLRKFGPLKVVLKRIQIGLCSLAFQTPSDTLSWACMLASLCTGGSIQWSCVRATRHPPTCSAEKSMLIYSTIARAIRHAYAIPPHNHVNRLGK